MAERVKICVKSIKTNTNTKVVFAQLCQGKITNFPSFPLTCLKQIFFFL